MRQSLFVFFAIVASVYFLSCDNSDESASLSGGVPYDPSKPIELATFYPDSGGMATKIILEGSNFGNSPEAIRIYFNEKRAAVVQSTGSMIYAITPRQPGDDCVISVAVGNDSVVYGNTFEYTTVIGISTVMGVPGANLTQGGTLAEARIQYPQHIAVDEENNVYVTNQNSGFYLINEESDVVMALLSTGGYNAPSIDKTTGRHILLPNNNMGTYLRFSTDDAFSYRQVNLTRVPNPDAGIAGGWSFSFKHQFASCEEDGLIYFGSRSDSYVVRVDPSTREMTPLYDLRSYQSNYFSMFHPTDKHMLYMAARNRYCIYTYNIRTNEFKLFAGRENTPGHADGDRLEAALFGEVIQVDFDKDGNLFVADRTYHCIRKITPEGMVSTIIGIPGTSGYIDGTADYALLSYPWGVAVDKDGSVYVADYGNQCVRKLSIQ